MAVIHLTLTRSSDTFPFHLQQIRYQVSLYVFNYALHMTTPSVDEELGSTKSRQMHFVAFLPGGDGGELVGGVEDPAGSVGVGGAGLGHALPWEDGWG